MAVEQIENRIPRRAVIFDWDGTLFDSMAYKRSNFVAILSELGADPRKVEELHLELSGLPRRELFSRIYRESLGRGPEDPEIESFSREYTRRNLESARSARAFEDAAPLLERLQGRCKCFVSSSSDPEELLEAVRHSGLSRWIDEALGSRPGFAKGPEHVEYIRGLLGGCRPEEILIVGDDRQDLVLAARAGVDALRIEREAGGTGAEALRTLGDLEPLLGLAGDATAACPGFSDADMDRTGAAGNYMGPVYEDLLSDRPFGRMLDIGCGNGFFTQYLKARRSFHLAGVDGSRYGLEQARARGFDEVKLVQDFCRDPIPFPDGSFDLIQCKDVLEHLADPMRVVKEAHRLLRVGGRLLVLVPNHFPLWFRFKFLLKPNIDTQGYFPDATEWDFPHIRFFTADGLRQLLGIAGFRVIREYSSDFGCFPGLARLPGGRKLLRRLAASHPTQFSTAFVMLAERG